VTKWGRLGDIGKRREELEKGKPECSKKNAEGENPTPRGRVVKKLKEWFGEPKK